MAITAECGGDLLIGRRVVPGSEQDDTATEDESLWGRVGSDEGFELVAKLIRKLEDRTERTRHEGCLQERDRVVRLMKNIMVPGLAPG